MFFVALFLDLLFDQKRPPKWTPKWYQSLILGSNFSHMVQDLALGTTVVHFGLIFGPPGLHVGLIWVLFWGPKASILAMFKEILEHQFLEYPKANVLEMSHNPFLEHLLCTPQSKCSRNVSKPILEHLLCLTAH